MPGFSGRIFVGSQLTLSVLEIDNIFKASKFYHESSTVHHKKSIDRKNLTKVGLVTGTEIPSMTVKINLSREPRAVIMSERRNTSMGSTWLGTNLKNVILVMVHSLCNRWPIRSCSDHPQIGGYASFDTREFLHKL